MVSNFLDTLGAPVSNMMLANTTTSFSSFVLPGERVQKGMKRGKLENKQTEIESQKKAGRKRKQEKRKKGQGSVLSFFFCFSSS